jgi:hypothetical protein
LAGHAKDRTLVLHIGLHKTATTYIQNVLSVRRYDLLREGVLYPLAGSGLLARGVDRPTVNTREGAQSGHAMFTMPGNRRPLVAQLLDELPETASTVLLSSEDFSLGLMTPQEYLARFSAFGTIKVVLVLRRQDFWIESFYKQVVDQYGNFETRSFEEYLAQVGPRLLDFHARFSPWRDLVGPDGFHVLSYDDLPGGGAEICRRLVEIAGIDGPLLDKLTSVDVPRYDSVRAIDTLGLRVLNSHRLEDRDRRVATAKLIYDAAPEGEIALLTPQLQQAIKEAYAPVNERIEKEWFAEPVPGFCFRAPIGELTGAMPTAPDLLDYVNRVLDLCATARQADRRAAADEKSA